MRFDSKYSEIEDLGIEVFKIEDFEVKGFTIKGFEIKELKTLNSELDYNSL